MHECLQTVTTSQLYFSNLLHETESLLRNQYSLSWSMSHLKNQKIHYLVHNRPALVPIMIQLIPTHTPHTVSLRFTLISSSHLLLGLYSYFSNHNCYVFITFPYIPYTLLISYSDLIAPIINGDVFRSKIFFVIL